ncbi:hypothetical protein P8825_15035 [Shouchella clausii]|uniref:hypothetical protein n=1 Tax=Shouchella clausii TaxID=79880 RepID=UPI002DBC9859|nr:hypothetical protein [Shouchella clausii]MEB5480878.1 hypothetical protein [Shouchella clausii]
MGAYDESVKCPYCSNECHADFVDNGVGMVQCGPYHCYNCGASEIGPERLDWYYKDREGNILHLPGKKRYFPPAKRKLVFGKPLLKPGHPFSEIELKTGYYEPRTGRISPYANTVNGELVNHKQAKEAYNVGLLDDKEKATVRNTDLLAK